MRGNCRRSMPSLSELPGEVKQARFCKALGRVGFVVNKVGRNGSHIKIILYGLVIKNR